jgi:hypothetical protein
MALMDKVMESMIGRMSLEKKQEMMLKMMPMMMKDVNMAETMLKMIPQMMDQITLMDIFAVLKKLFPHILNGINSVAELMANWNELLPKMLKKLPDVMIKIMPFMEIMMPVIMNKMLPVAMSEDHIEKVKNFPDKMLPKMLEQEEVKKHMPKMMSIFMPHCLDAWLPYMESELKSDFLKEMDEILNKYKNEVN